MDSCKNINQIAETCSSCGNCLFSCPVYNAELIEPLSPRGRINLIQALTNDRLQPTASNRKYIYQCTLCGSCQHTCTKGVDFISMMIDYRTVAADGKKIPLSKKVILWLYQSVLFKRFTWVVDILVKTPLRKKLTIPRRRKARLKKLFTRKPEQENYDILFFPGCVNTHFYPEIIEKSVSLLRENGFSVVVPKGLVCCGFPYISQGWKEKFFKLRKTNNRVLSRFRFKYMVIPCGTCTKTFSHYYGGGSVLEPEREREEPGFEIYEFTRFCHTFLNELQPRPIQHEPGEEKKKITWHDPCHTLKSLDIGKEPRHFMKKMGDDFVDDSSALCCGFGGLFSVGFPSTSKKILNRKENKLDEIGADTVVTGCPGCYLHVRENLPEGKEVKFFSDIF